jgi:hypothetical protein
VFLDKVPEQPTNAQGDFPMPKTCGTHHDQLSVDQLASADIAHLQEFVGCNGFGGLD